MNIATEINGTHLVADAIAVADADAKIDAPCEWALNNVRSEYTNQEFTANDIRFSLSSLVAHSIYYFSELLEVVHVVHTKRFQQIGSEAPFNSTCPAGVLQCHKGS